LRSSIAIEHPVR